MELLVLEETTYSRLWTGDQLDRRTRGVGCRPEKWIICFFLSSSSFDGQISFIPLRNPSIFATFKFTFSLFSYFRFLCTVFKVAIKSDNDPNCDDRISRSTTCLDFLSGQWVKHPSGHFHKDFSEKSGEWISAVV